MNQPKTGQSPTGWDNMDAIRDAVVSEELDFIGEGPAMAKSPEHEETIVEEKAKKAMGNQEADMINHLLFHKSIIREPHERDIDLDSYLQIMKELDMGIHVALDNPVDRAAAIAFQLVIDERFDPWNLDIAEFTKLYLQKLKQEDEVNFIIAGRLIMMAWNVLKSQSQHVLTHADRNDEPEECYFEDWDIMPYYEEPKEINFSQYILGSQESIITEAVRATDVRQVTLMSLIEAFDEAREEIALKERAKRFVTNIEEKPIDFGEKMHKESLQEDISTTWQRICMCHDMKIPITQVWDNNDAYDKVTVLVSTLFLAKMEKIKLTQRKLPYGDIMIENIEGQDMQTIQEDAIVEGTNGYIPEEIPEEIKATSAEDLAVV